MTPPEVLLWQRLRQRPSGHKFRRQHPLGNYVADFYCASRKLVIEVDGAVHDNPSNIAYDRRRDRWMRDNGLVVFRISATDVLRDLDQVVQSIIALADNPLHQPSPTATAGPPPRSGEE